MVRISETANIQSLQSFKKKAVNSDAKPHNTGLEKDTVEIKNTKKITIKEGLCHIAEGIGTQLGDMIKNIINHPIKTVLSIGAVSAGLLALPFIGIPTAVGGAALCLTYAGLAVSKGLYHTAQFFKNNNNENYNEARKSLKQIGKDIFDISLSLPFVPKSINSIKRFAKFGKVQINHFAIEDLKNAKGIKNKFNAIKDAGKNVDKSINFREATEIELAKYKNIPDSTKAKIRQYIEEYNVPKEKIPDVVLEQWAKEHGISTKPKWSYEATPKDVAGQANPTTGRIIIKDYKKPDINANGSRNAAPEWEQVKSRRYNDDLFIITYKNRRNGQIRNDYLSNSLNNSRRTLLKNQRHLSPEARRILTVIHEREHIDQYARIYQLDPKRYNYTPEAIELYGKMAREMPAMTQREINIYNTMMRYNKRGTSASYVMNPREIGARRAEEIYMHRADFQTLDKVFKTSSNMPLPNNILEINLDVLRTLSTEAN